jgi:hypothetical protein
MKISEEYLRNEHILKKRKYLFMISNKIIIIIKTIYISYNMYTVFFEFIYACIIKVEIIYNNYIYIYRLQRKFMWISRKKIRVKNIKKISTNNLLQANETIHFTTDWSTINSVQLASFSKLSRLFLFRLFVVAFNLNIYI